MSGAARGSGVGRMGVAGVTMAGRRGALRARGEMGLGVGEEYGGRIESEEPAERLVEGLAPGVPGVDVGRASNTARVGLGWVEGLAVEGLSRTVASGTLDIAGPGVTGATR